MAVIFGKYTHISPDSISKVEEIDTTSTDNIAPTITASKTGKRGDYEALQEIRKIMQHIIGPQLSSPSSEISIVGENLLRVVSDLSSTNDLAEFLSKSGKVTQVFRDLVDITKVLAAKASGQLRVVMPTLTTALQCSHEIIHHQITSPIPDDAQLIRMRTQTEVLLHTLAEESNAFVSQLGTDTTEISNSVRVITNITKKYIDCMCNNCLCALLLTLIQMQIIIFIKFRTNQITLLREWLTLQQGW